MDSDPQLRRWYRSINRALFGDELPDVPIWWEPCGTACAVTEEIQSDPLELVIKVDPFLAQSPRLVRLHIAHESAHVKLWKKRNLKDHGKRFDDEIKRLCSIKQFRKLL